MTTALDVCNKGLAKIGASRISSMAPPRTALERHCADFYPHWRDTELSGPRRWTCCLDRRTLAQSGDPYTDDCGVLRFAYPLPTDVYRAVRTKSTQWIQRGRTLFDPNPTLTVEVLTRITEDEMDAFFIEVLACRVAVESVEFATQSSTKSETADQKYARALNNASRANAFQIGQEDVSVAEYNDEWLTARLY